MGTTIGQIKIASDFYPYLKNMMPVVQPSGFDAEVNPDDYYFYHTVDLPGLGEMQGEWDLRNATEEYLGNINVTNKRVLEVGTTSGFLSFHMENKGASVISFDLLPSDVWNIALQIDKDEPALTTRSHHIRKLNNAYQLSHALLNSRAEFVQGTVYAISDHVGLVDISTFGNTLQLIRDPFLALQQVARITKETIVITGILGNNRQLITDRLFGWLGSTVVRKVRHKLLGPSMIFRPVAAMSHLDQTWWYLTPELLEEFLRVLGFGDVHISYHRQYFVRHNKHQPMYTLVANRTAPMRLV